MNDSQAGPQAAGSSAPATAEGLWPAPTASAPVRGRVTVPGSKSETNRALLLAAISDSPSRITGALDARDTSLMVGALRALGATIEMRGSGELLVTPLSRGADVGHITIDCGLAGTVMRFIPAIAGLVRGTITIDGDPAARKRPMKALIDGLRQCGLSIESADSCLPLTIHATGTVAGGHVNIDASDSSQFVSALLLAGATYERGLTLVHTGSTLPSLPHIEMSMAMVREQGVDVTAHAGEHRQWSVLPGRLTSVDRAVEPDLSNALPFLAAAAATGGTVTIAGWPESTTQPGHLALPLLEAMGCTWSLTTEPREGAGLTLTGPRSLKPIDADMSAIGELVPTMTALCLLAEGESCLRNIAHIRGHETDRVSALIDIAGSAGGAARDDDGDLTIRPIPAQLLRADSQAPGTVISTHDDHRLATAGAILGLRRPNVLVENIATTGKTMPDFPGLWLSLVEGT